MPGMLAGSVRSRKRTFNTPFFAGWDNYNETNDAADDIIAQPDKFLLSEAERLEVSGGYVGFGVKMGCAAAGVIGVCLARPSVAAHLGRAQLSASELGLVLAGGLTGGFFGNMIAVSAFGDQRRYRNHWMAYTFVKTQNRFTPGSTLTKAPMYY